MPGDFEFRAQQDLLARLSREVEALKRQAASGVMFTVEMPVLGASGGRFNMDGPDLGGLRCDVYRHNEFVSLTSGGSITSVTASGVMYVTTPWIHYTANGAFDLAGSWRGYDASAPAESSGNVFASNGSNQLYLFNLAGAQVSPTSPFTWAPGDFLYVEARLRLAPGS